MAKTTYRSNGEPLPCPYIRYGKILIPEPPEEWLKIRIVEGCKMTLYELERYKNVKCA